VKNSQTIFHFPFEIFHLSSSGDQVAGWQVINVTSA